MPEPEKKQQQEIADARITARDKPWYMPALVLFIKLSAWIAFPVIIASFAGRWLDQRYDTEPWLFLSTVGAAFVVSMIGLIRNALAEYKKLGGSNGKTDAKNGKGME